MCLCGLWAGEGGGHRWCWTLERERERESRRGRGGKGEGQAVVEHAPERKAVGAATQKSKLRKHERRKHAI